MVEGKEGVECNDDSVLKAEECELKEFERNNYFYGKLMTVSDFQLEQGYLNEKRHLINRLVLGNGVVCGLNVEAVETTTEKCSCGPGGDIEMVGARWVATMSTGAALDCTGREIIVSRSGRYFISEETIPEKLGKYFGLYIRRKDNFKAPVPSPANTSACSEICCYAHIQENFELVFGDLPNIFKLGFDRNTYTSNDIATLFLITPRGAGSSENPKIILKSSMDSIEVDLTPVELPEKESPGASIFSGMVKFKKSEIQPAAAEGLDLSPADAGDVSVGPFVPRELIPIARPPVIALPPVSTPGEVEPSIKEITVDSNDSILAVPKANDGPPYAASAFVREYLRPKIEKKRIGDDYYRIWLKECACCDKPEVLLTVLVLDVESEPKKANILVDPTGWYRSIVYNNPMLYDLISCHLVDTSNPHNFRAIQRIMYEDMTIGNKDGSPVDVPEVTFKAGNGINIIPEDIPTGADPSSKIYKSIKFESKNVGGEAVANSGTINYPEIAYRKYWISKPYPHGAGGDDGTPPSITLGLWNETENNRTVFYMEDMEALNGPLAPVNNQNPPSEDPPNPDIKKFLAGENNHSLFFKAIQVTNSEFQILVAKTKNQPAPSPPGVIRWWAIKSKNLAQIGPATISVAGIRLKDVETGNEVKTPSVGSKAAISITLKNDISSKQLCTVKVDVIDKNGNAIFSESEDKVAVSPNGEKTVEIKWQPSAKGNYTIKVYGLDKDGNKLFDPSEFTFRTR